MPLGKSVEEVIQVAAVNSTAFALTFTHIEIGLKIVLLLISVLYTLDKWRGHRKQINKNKQ